MSFRNLFFELSLIRDHNFCDFLDRLERVKEVFLVAKFREGYEEGMIEPYFNPIIPLTLDPASCAGFFRTNPSWPISERDYYLSKLFQFLFLPIQIRYEVESAEEDAVRERLEGMLDRIPDDVLGHLYKWDWWDFYDDTFTLKLDELLEVLAERLQAFCEQARRGALVKKDERWEVASSSHRRRRRSQNEERNAIIASYLRRRPDDRPGLCKVLDRNGIPTTRNMQAHELDTWWAAWQDPEFNNNVQQIFSKALKNAGAVKSAEFP